MHSFTQEQQLLLGSVTPRSVHLVEQWRICTLPCGLAMHTLVLKNVLLERVRRVGHP